MNAYLQVNRMWHVEGQLLLPMTALLLQAGGRPSSIVGVFQPPCSYLQTWKFVFTSSLCGSLKCIYKFLARHSRGIVHTNRFMCTDCSMAECFNELSGFRMVGLPTGGVMGGDGPKCHFKEDNLNV